MTELTNKQLDNIMEALKNYEWVQSGSGADDIFSSYTLKNVKDCLKRMVRRKK